MGSEQYTEYIGLSAGSIAYLALNARYPEQYTVENGIIISRAYPFERTHGYFVAQDGMGHTITLPGYLLNDQTTVYEKLIHDGPGDRTLLFTTLVDSAGMSLYDKEGNNLTDQLRWDPLLMVAISVAKTKTGRNQDHHYADLLTRSAPLIIPPEWEEQ